MLIAIYHVTYLSLVVILYIYVKCYLPCILHSYKFYLRYNAITNQVYANIINRLNIVSCFYINQGLECYLYHSNSWKIPWEDKSMKRVLAGCTTLAIFGR